MRIKPSSYWPSHTKCSSSYRSVSISFRLRLTHGGNTVVQQFRYRGIPLKSSLFFINHLPRYGA